MIYQDEFIDAPWGKICVLCAGPKDAKPVVFLHGASDSAGSFKPLVNRLPNGFRILMPELPSCGKSDPFPLGQPLFPVDHVIILKLVAEHYKLDTFSYVGHSMGAQIGLLYNAIYPNKIDRFVSLDSLVYPPVEGRHFGRWYKQVYDRFYDPKNYKRFTSTAESGPLYTIDQALETLMRNRGLTKEAGLAVLERAIVDAGNGQYRFCWEQRLKLPSAPAMSAEFQHQLYSGMRIPHLIIFADQSIKAYVQYTWSSRPNKVSTNSHMLQEWIDKNPHFRAAIVEGNHDVHINSPVPVVRLVSKFLLGDELGVKSARDVMNALKDAYEAHQPEKLPAKL